MKTVILAGGLGTRLSEETAFKPKPMVEIGGKPILWHIMSVYAAHGFSEFIVALGYKGEVIKEYFLNFRALNSDLSIDLQTGDATIHAGSISNWKVHLVDTGPNTQTGGRLARLRSWLADDDTFLMTYGDGLSNVDLQKLVAFHRSHGKLATVTAVRPAARFGNLAFDAGTGAVSQFIEKPQASGGWINGGFFVLDRKVLDYITGDEVPWELAPMQRLTEEGQLCAFRHDGFWQPMDTLRDKRHLEEHWEKGDAPWKVWR